MIASDEISTLIEDLESFLQRTSPQMGLEKRSHRLLSIAQRAMYAYMYECSPGDDLLKIIRRMDRPDQVELEQAHRSLVKAQQVFEHIGDRMGAGIAIANRGVMFAVVAAYPEAIELHAQALGIFTSLGEHRLASRCIANIGIMNVAMEPYTRLLEAMFQAVPLLQFERYLSNTAAREDLLVIFETLSECQQALMAFGPAFGIFNRPS